MSLVITVSDPQRVIETLPPATYVTYKVSTSEKPEVTVTRRFADFLWLYDQLGIAMPGMIIPAIPKNPKVNRFGEFVDTKRRALEKFLNRIANHIELSKSSVFETFLYATSAEFKEATRKSPLSSRAMEWLEDKVSLVKDHLSLVKDKVVQTKDRVEAQASRSSFFSKILSSPGKASFKELSHSKEEKDDEFVQIGEEVGRWEPIIEAVCKKASALNSSVNDVSRALLELGDGLRRLGDFESGDQSAALSSASTCILSYANLVEAHKREGLESFEESLEEYANIVDSIQRALSLRGEARLAYQQAITSPAVVPVREDGVKEGEGDKEPLPQSKAEQGEKQAAAEQAARVKLERVSDDFITDYERFKHERSQDIHASLLGFFHAEVAIDVY